MALMRITSKTTGIEMACVESYPTKASALDAMAVEEGFSDFAALCAERDWKKRDGWNRFEAKAA